ncbi:MAG: leucine-rich repeat protein [Paludibacteraceae bacterium]|nr:leucine-rich repeat protein [Paludibacteraceae bacterium]
MKKISLLFLSLVLSVSAALADVVVDGINYRVVPSSGKLANVVDYCGYVIGAAQTATVDIPGAVFYTHTLSGSSRQVTDTFLVIGIDPCAFKGKTISRVTIPSSVISIGDSAFYGCSFLSDVTIAQATSQEMTALGVGLRKIGVRAFAYCTDLESISLPTSLSSIDDYAFYASGLVSADIPADMIGTHLFDNCTSLTSATFPSGRTCIPDYTFYNCSSLTQYTIPANVEEIGAYAFAKSGLTSLNVPAKVTQMGVSAFFNCTSLTSVTLGTGITYLNPNTFLSCKNLTTVILPSTLVTIQRSVFENCSALQTIVLPNSVTTLREKVFKDCTSLLTVTLSSNITTLPHHLFQNCTSLYSVSMPAALTAIEDSAFYSCSKLTEFRMPATVQTIGSGAFEACSKLQDLYITDLAAWCNVDLQGNNIGTLPYGTVGASNIFSTGGTANPSRLYLNDQLVTDLVIPEGVTRINPLVFAANSTILSVSFPQSLRSIGAGAFEGTVSLSELNIPEGVTVVEEAAFSCIPALHKVTLPSTLDSIGKDVFTLTAAVDTLICYAAVPPVCADSTSFFSSLFNTPVGLSHDVTLFVHTRSLQAYQTADVWSLFNNYIGLEEFFTITVLSSDESVGSVDGGGEYCDGETATISATPVDGYRFVKWNDGNTDNPRQVLVSEDKTYIANFELIPEALDDMAGDAPAALKVLRDGKLVIIRNGEAFDATGARL